MIFTRLAKTAFLYTTVSVSSVLFAAEAQEEGDVRKLRTVVVTTQKTSESLQNVPIAVSAFDEEVEVEFSTQKQQGNSSFFLVVEMKNPISNSQHRSEDL